MRRRPHTTRGSSNAAFLAACKASKEESVAEEQQGPGMQERLRKTLTWALDGISTKYNTGKDSKAQVSLVSLKEAEADRDALYKRVAKFAAEDGFTIELQGTPMDGLEVNKYLRKYKIMLLDTCRRVGEDQAFVTAAAFDLKELERDFVEKQLPTGLATRLDEIPGEFFEVGRQINRPLQVDMQQPGLTMPLEPAMVVVDPSRMKDLVQHFKDLGFSVNEKDALSLVLINEIAHLDFHMRHPEKKLDDVIAFRFDGQELKVPFRMLTELYSDLQSLSFKTELVGPEISRIFTLVDGEQGHPNSLTADLSSYASKSFYRKNKEVPVPRVLFQDPQKHRQAIEGLQSEIRSIFSKFLDEAFAHPP